MFMRWSTFAWPQGCWMIPQLRVRSEYTFRSCYGPVNQLAEHLRTLRCPAAGLVDRGSTWGHVEWERLLAPDVSPMFGAELAMPQENGLKPAYWLLAEEPSALYRLVSKPPETPEELAETAGVLRFAGAALTDPDTFDYIDVNPRSRRRTKRALALAKRTGKPVVVTSDNDYPGPEDRERFLAWDMSQKMTPQHLLTDEELRAFSDSLPPGIGAQAIKNCHEIAELLQGVKLARAPMIHFEGDLDAIIEQGKTYRLKAGHIKAWTQEYEDRLRREIGLIKEKEYESYFLVVADLVVWAKERMLVGPARGSSAGSLVCYLLRITEVDPLVHGLLFERFIDLNRADLPDIDIDFNDQKRDQVFKYLEERYGHECVARIGSINRLKPRSVMAHVGKKLGIPKGATYKVANVLFEYSSGDSRYGNSLQDTLDQTEPGSELLRRWPEAKLMTELEEHASHTGVHAAGVIVSNFPVTNFCAVKDGIAQVDKKAAEALGLLKIDALGLRTLGVIEDAGCVDNETLYGLPLDDPEVFSVFNNHKYSGVFQFEGAAQRRVASQISIDDFKHIDHVTALARPGPLGGGATGSYIKRQNKEEEVTYQHESMQSYLGDTNGVVLYQEQVMRIVRELGSFSWEDTSTIRKAMSGRKGTEFFDQHGKRFAQGAAKVGLEVEEAQEIWKEICSFGAWGMNKSHTTSYAMISYWCAYMKRYHALEYAAACLRNAKDEDQTIEILRDLDKEGINYKAFDPQLSDVSWSSVDGQLLGGFKNLIGIGPVKANYYVQKRASDGLSEADLKALAKREMKFATLYPAKALWADFYNDPVSHNIRGKVKEFGALQDGENAVVICKMTRQERRDENETVRLNRRGYAKRGQTLFLDMFVVDDSISKPVLLRIGPRKWFEIGKRLADRAAPGDWFLIRGTWLEQFSMMQCDKIKCLNNPEITNAAS